MMSMQTASHVEEQTIYDTSPVSSYSSTSSVSPNSSSSESLIPGVIYTDYSEWHQGNVDGQRTVELPQYQTYMSYPQVSQSELMSAAGGNTYWQGEVPIHHGVPAFSYTPQTTERIPQLGYDYSSTTPAPSTTKSGKPKRRRVQSCSQRKAANIRERRRMFHLNEAFDDLRKRLPSFNYEKRLSRIETLRLAMTYITFMKDISNGQDPKNVKLQTYKDEEDIEADVFRDLKENGVHLADNNLNQRL